MSTRVILTVPAHDLRKVEKCREYGADRILLDLEDGVPMDRKDDARRNAEAHILPGDLVRINHDHDLAVSDLRALSSFPDVDVLYPKCEPDKVGAPKGYALIESPAGVLGLAGMLAAGGVRGVFFGWADFLLACGLNPHRGGGLMWRAATDVVLAAKAFGLEVVFGAVCPGDEHWLARVRDCGFDGAVVTHPSLIPLARYVFSRQDAELAWAKRFSSSSPGAPVTAMAEAILR